ncbi:MAG: iron-containing alcohol dehydrogenase [Sphaerochaetaceae bacterium]|nr:iron-containing alcohol dehydrogenase [Sphaerochaetaceae bacterium]
MNNFVYRCPTRIIFGKDVIKDTGTFVKNAGGTDILMVYGGGSIKKNGIYNTVVESLKESDVKFTELSGVKPNPRLDLVLEGIKLVREKKINLILAVGGGSTIDTCKAIAFGSAVPEGEDIWDDYFMVLGKPIPKGIPVGVVLTIPAAGSEMSNSCVITNHNTLNKRGISNENNYPVFSVIDPQVCYSLPAYQTACGCSDMLSHMMERYFTNTSGVDLTDELLEGAMRVVLNYAPKAVSNPDVYEYREQLMFASTLAHNNLFGCGRQQDWASHWLEHELSAQYDIAHGAGLAIMTPAWMRYVWKENPQRFVQFFTRVLGSTLPVTDVENLVKDGIERLENWYRLIGLPVRLSEANIDGSNFELFAERCLSGGRTAAGGLKKLYRDDILAIYRLAL